MSTRNILTIEHSIEELLTRATRDGLNSESQYLTTPYKIGQKVTESIIDELFNSLKTHQRKDNSLLKISVNVIREF